MPLPKPRTRHRLDLGTTFAVILALDDLVPGRNVDHIEGDKITPMRCLLRSENIFVGKEGREALSTMPVSGRRFGAQRDPRPPILSHKQLVGRRYPPDPCNSGCSTLADRRPKKQIALFSKAWSLRSPAYFDESPPYKKQRWTLLLAWLGSVLEHHQLPTARPRLPSVFSKASWRPITRSSVLQQNPGLCTWAAARST